MNFVDSVALAIVIMASSFALVLLLSLLGGVFQTLWERGTSRTLVVVMTVALLSWAIYRTCAFLSS